MNKKIVGLLTAAALVTGMGGYGTVAYFSDKAEVNENINITMGTLDVEANWKDSNWKQRPGNTESVVEGANFANVKPGDYFYRDIVVKNAGTLKANTTITLNNLFGDETVKAELKLLGNNNTNIIETSKDKAYSSPFMESQQEYTFRLYLKVDQNMSVGTVEKVVNNTSAQEVVTVKAEQLKF